MKNLYLKHYLVHLGGSVFHIFQGLHLIMWGDWGVREGGGWGGGGVERDGNPQYLSELLWITLQYSSLSNI